MFDTMIFDKILETSLQNKLNTLREKANIEYLVTSIQADEVAAIPDDKAEKRHRLFLLMLSIQPRMIPTHGNYILGVSRLGYSRFGYGDIMEEIRKQDKGLNPSRHALIGTTALMETTVFVTEDAERQNILKRIALRECITKDILNFDLFLTWLENRLGD